MRKDIYLSGMDPEILKMIEAGKKRKFITSTKQYIITLIVKDNQKKS